jgi:homocysteine S-methyltransferase
VEALGKYYRTYAGLARKHGLGLILETATWRASTSWGKKLGYSFDQLAEINKQGVSMLETVRAEYEAPTSPIVISGCLGPRGDGYIPSERMTTQEAEQYHAAQIGTLAGTSVDALSALTMNYVEEALGVARAAETCSVPVVISFTVETNGRLPTGQKLGDAINQVDQETCGYPMYYMVNCAHTSHFEHVLTTGESWCGRIRGLRANASSMSHAELDEAPALDAGNPVALGRDYARLKSGKLPNLNVVGGCCGTDDRHVEQMALACLPLFQGAPDDAGLI